jgi:hypothetical protein
MPVFFVAFLPAVYFDLEGNDMEEARHGRGGMHAPAITIDIARLKPQEIVLLGRIATSAQTEGFPALDRCAEDFWRQLKSLPQVDLPFAREVCQAFAISPFPIDRLNLGQLLRSLTVTDHEAGFLHWHRLVRDENPAIRRETYQLVHERLTHSERPPDAGLAEEGLSVADAWRLRDAFVAAQLGENVYVVEQTHVGEILREATVSFASLAGFD